MPTRTEPESSFPKHNGKLILLASLFAALAMPLTDDRAVGIPLREWQLHAKYLDGVAMTLAKYKDVHGRYPDNNQGLQSMDTFDARFEALMLTDTGDPAPTNPDPAGFFGRQIPRYFWDRASNEIRRSRTADGRFPQNRESPMFWPLIMIEPGQSDDENGRRVRIAISKSDCLFLLGPDCVFDPSLTPYGYENRTGLDAKLFVDSIANSDPGRNYSRELAPGVHVYSYNARDCYRDYRGNFLARWARILIPGGLAAVLLAVAAYRAFKYKLRKVPLVFPGLVALLALGASSVIRTTCYIPRSMPRRNPDDLVAQKQLLEKFRSSGVITQETYGKAMQGFETDAVFVPFKEPEPGREKPQAPP